MLAGERCAQIIHEALLCQFSLLIKGDAITCNVHPLSWDQCMDSTPNPSSSCPRMRVCSNGEPPQSSKSYRLSRKDAPKLLYIDWVVLWQYSVLYRILGRSSLAMRNVSTNPIGCVTIRMQMHILFYMVLVVDLLRRREVLRNLNPCIIYV